MQLHVQRIQLNYQISREKFSNWHSIFEISGLAENAVPNPLAAQLAFQFLLIMSSTLSMANTPRILMRSTENRHFLVNQI
jgi:hypothetical protein